MSIDKFIQLVGVRGSRPNGLDISTLLESLTFDITGDLSFGEAFGALDSGKVNVCDGVMLVTH